MPDIETSSGSGDNKAEVLKVSVRIPPFWKTNPSLWFSQLESQFYTSGVRDDKTKFHTVVAAIESNVLSQVSDVVLTPPQQDLYKTLKTRLIERFADSEQQRLKRLLQEIELGDRKPSELLREMRELAGTAGTVSDELLKSIWTQRLPEQMRMILSTNEGDVNKLALMADKIAEVTQHTVSEVAGSSHATEDRTTKLEKQIAQLSKQVAALSTSLSHQRSRSRSKSFQRFNKNKSSSPHSKSAYCFYHQKFGKAAQKCKHPCSFTKSENSPANR